MATINQLPLVDTISPADQIPIYSASNGDARRTPVNLLTSFFQSLQPTVNYATQVLIPASDFVVEIDTQNNFSLWLLIQPATTITNGTIRLPLNPPDGQEVLITTTQQVTNVSFEPNGAISIYGAPAALAAEDATKFRFASLMNSWYRVV